MKTKKRHKNSLDGISFQNKPIEIYLKNQDPEETLESDRVYFKTSNRIKHKEHKEKNGEVIIMGAKEFNLKERYFNNQPHKIKVLARLMCGQKLNSKDVSKICSNRLSDAAKLLRSLYESELYQVIKRTGNKGIGYTYEIPGCESLDMEEMIKLSKKKLANSEFAIDPSSETESLETEDKPPIEDQTKTIPILETPPTNINLNVNISGSIKFKFSLE